MSIAAGWLILAVVVLRLLLAKAPKWLPCALWAAVAVRLICPFSFESALSLIPSAETVPKTVITGRSFDISSGVNAIDAPVNQYIGSHYYAGVTVPAGAGGGLMQLMGWIWLAGMAAMLVYAAVSYLRLRRRVKASICAGGNLWICDEVKTPFILGVARPRIYLPSGMNDAARAQVLAHENAHLRRRDNWWKPLGFLLLAVYWFNPLCWLAYVLFCRDIELACDERAVRTMKKDEMIAYSETLLACSAVRGQVSACPLAFGEVGVKKRVKAVLNYKKPAFWLVIAAAAVCVVVAVCFLTNPVNGDAAQTQNISSTSSGESTCDGLIINMLNSDGAYAEDAEDALVDSLTSSPKDTLEAIGARESGICDWLCWTVAIGIKGRSIDASAALSTDGLSDNGKNAAALISKYLSSDLPAPESWREVYMDFWDGTVPEIEKTGKLAAVGIFDTNYDGVPELAVWQEGSTDGTLYYTDGAKTYHNVGSVYNGAPPDDARSVLKAQNGSISRDTFNAFLNSWRPSDAGAAQSDGTQGTALTADQIAQANAAFAETVTDAQGNDSVNPITCFFTSFYDKPQDINIDDFLRYFPYSENVSDGAEFAALKKLGNWPFDKDVAFADMPVPISKYKAADIDKVLSEYAGITLGELGGAGLDQVCYLKEYDAYYNFTSDFGPGIFVCLRGEIDGDTVRLYGEAGGGGGAVLTLQKKDGRYLIVSYQQAGT